MGKHRVKTCTETLSVIWKKKKPRGNSGSPIFKIIQHYQHLDGIEDNRYTKHKHPRRSKTVIQFFKKELDCTQGSLYANQFILLIYVFLSMQKCDRILNLSLNKSNTAPAVSRKLLFLVLKISTITYVK